MKQAVEGLVARGGKSSVPTVARLALPGPVHERSVRDPRDLEVCLACQRARCEYSVARRIIRRDRRSGVSTSTNGLLSNGCPPSRSLAFRLSSGSRRVL